MYDHGANSYVLVRNFVLHRGEREVLYVGLIRNLVLILHEDVVTNNIALGMIENKIKSLWTIFIA